MCVDMFGEGFDMPSLKVAALHDPHRSLGVTLQFIGRFARTTGGPEERATVVAPRPDLGHDENLRRLYAQDADWNRVIRELSAGASDEQQDIDDFEAGFSELPDQVTVRAVTPKMSTVVYRTRCEDWHLDALATLFPEESLLTVPIAVNPDRHVVWFVTEDRESVQWGDLAVVEDVMHELYVLYWDEPRGLLYINNSANRGVVGDLARALCGGETTLISGPDVYRVMAHLDRLVPTNVGVLDARSHSRRFSFHVGPDVAEGFPVAEANTKMQTNIFALGYDRARPPRHRRVAQGPCVEPAGCADAQALGGLVRRRRVTAHGHLDQHRRRPGELHPPAGPDRVARGARSPRR